VRLAPGESLGPHAHQAGWLAVTVRGGKGPGAHEWFAAGTAQTLAVAAGGDAVEIVELEPR
jgi:hypothetical protein